MPVRFACLTGVAPGTDLAAQCAAIAAAGCLGVETLLFERADLGVLNFLNFVLANSNRLN